MEISDFKIVLRVLARGNHFLQKPGRGFCRDFSKDLPLNRE
jgi:hypothetical protein